MRDSRAQGDERAALLHAWQRPWAVCSRSALSVCVLAGAETGGGADDGPKPKTLVELHQEQQASEKAAKKGKADWEGQHPWKPWNRDTDLDVRKANPKGKESILNNQHMGKLGDRFGGGRRESTFM